MANDDHPVTNQRTIDKYSSQECKDYRKQHENSMEGKVNDLIARGVGFGPMYDRELKECTIGDIRAQATPRPVATTAKAIDKTPSK
jgi:hypothetical protein